MSSNELRSYFFKSTPIIGILLICGDFERAGINALSPSIDRQNNENELCEKILLGNRVNPHDKLKILLGSEKRNLQI